MRTFEYVAIGPDGQTTKGHALAADELQLDGDLESRGFTLLEAAPLMRRAGPRAAHMSGRELGMFTTQLATMLSAGVPIVRGIADLAPRMRTPGAREVLGNVVSDLKAGRPLSEALDNHEKSFPRIYRASVRAGELSGHLPKILQRLAAHMEWASAMRTTTTQALVYPTILCLAIVGLVIVLLTFLLPRILGMFPGGRDELPTQTRVLLTISEFLTGNWILLIGATFLAVLGLWFVNRNPDGRVFLSRQMLRVPRLGHLLRMLATSRFASTAGTLHGAGCDIFAVFEHAGDTCGNAYYASRFRDAATRIRRGQPITASLEAQPGMDPLLTQITHVGEESGDLGGCLDRLAEYYDQEVPKTVKWFLALLEPTILLVAGAVVAFILMAALLPIFSLYDNLM